VGLYIMGYGLCMPYGHRVIKQRGVAIGIVLLVVLTCQVVEW